MIPFCAVKRFNLVLICEGPTHVLKWFLFACLFISYYYKTKNSSSLPR